MEASSGRFLSSKMAPAVNVQPTPDWSAPWCRPLAGFGRPAWATVAAGGAVHLALNAVAPADAAMPRFVGADEQPPDTAYESFVHASGSVPTRDTLHDFFNGLVWCAYPRSKRLLNRLQAQAIARDGIGARRGPLRDAITLFDENGAVLSAPPELLAALRARDWKGLFVDRRADWSQARLWLFGHALIEKLVAPRKDITAHVLCAPAGLEQPPQLDAWLYETLDADLLASKPFSPLPVLGVPGWWPASEDPAFYQDTNVFRARRDRPIVPPLPQA